MDTLPVEIVCMIAARLPRARLGYREREERSTQALAEYQQVTAGLAGDRLEATVQRPISRIEPAEESGPKPRLAPYATISSKWQHAVERLLFDEITFRSADLVDFDSIFSARQAHRRRFLEHADFVISLPASCEDPEIPCETESTRLAKDKAVSEAGTHDQGEGSQHQYVYLSVHNVEKLPALPFIRKLNISMGSLPHEHENIQFHPATIIKLSEKAPGQQSLNWSYADAGVYYGLRRQLRNSVIEVLKTVQISPAVQKLSLCACSVIDTLPHDRELPNLIHPHQQDPLCTNLHRLVNDNNIRELWVESQLDSSLFWPYPETETPEPFWQSMEDLRVGYPIDAPDGRWYFRGPLGYGGHSRVAPLVGGYEPFPPGYGTLRGASQAIRFRTRDLNMGFRNREVPDDNFVAPLLISFARAISQMPLLKSATLWNNLMGEPMSFNVEYRAPGHLPEHLKHSGYQVKHDISKPHIMFEIASGDRRANGWKPSEEIIEMFRNVSMMAHDRQAHITAWWDDEGAGEEEEDDEGSEPEDLNFSDYYKDPETTFLEELDDWLAWPQAPTAAELEAMNTGVNSEVNR
ncbi:hypothetical protein QBC40DRAFT_325340 [Triangularia verruculosa]|uniref:Uncharacterized protein n=1 Tax=Triangularia verruculosa TaxID=2587418 RepID=A0AAN6XIR4_9PEZI|nr:hypothetical protein QBC40DRAFT_325340 [Triangularia verruculosa]